MNWNFLFSHKNLHEQVVIFNQTLMNTFLNYIPNKLITVDDKLLDKKLHLSFLILMKKIMIST